MYQQQPLGTYNYTPPPPQVFSTANAPTTNSLPTAPSLVAPPGYYGQVGTNPQLQGQLPGTNPQLQYTQQQLQYGQQSPYSQDMLGQQAYQQPYQQSYQQHNQQGYGQPYGQPTGTQQQMAYGNRDVAVDQPPRTESRQTSRKAQKSGLCCC